MLMDTQMQDDQQKDFLATLFSDMPVDNPGTGFHHSQMNHSDMNPASQQTPMQFSFDQAQVMDQSSSTANSLQHQGGGTNTLPQLNMEMLNGLMAQLSESTSNPLPPHSPSSPQQAMQHQQMLMEQQFKLQQLQQLQTLQNQIFQQQIALISSGRLPVNTQDGNAEGGRGRSVPFDGGLPTPGSSAELRAQQAPLEYVSPMILNYTPSVPERSSPIIHGSTADGGPYHSHPPQQHAHFYQHQLQQHLHQQQQHNLAGAMRGSTSAPAHIAFRNSQQDLDLDISPLTSPWLGAAHAGSSSGVSRQNKRRASSSGDEGSGGSSKAKKKPSPAILPSNPPHGHMHRRRGTNGGMTTPLLGSAKRVPAVVQDSPSPVDLSMPPPATPISTTASVHGTPVLGPSDPTTQQQLMPVTPASIMNMGRNPVAGGLETMGNSAEGSMSGSTKGGTRTMATRSKTGAKRAGSTHTSPSLKAILPAGPTGPSNAGSLGGVSAGASGPPKKTSHKAAEQKRRDSLKTTFDDLRGLLPPIPLSTADDPASVAVQPQRPLLPGALPPRGPPKAGGEGPNKGVSKLQLLICGNEFIRVLKGRVERRDEEIGRLRREVARLRRKSGMADVPEMERGAEAVEEEEVDLQKDLDAFEALTVGLASGASIIGDDDGDID